VLWAAQASNSRWHWRFCTLQMHRPNLIVRCSAVKKLLGPPANLFSLHQARQTTDSTEMRVKCISNSVVKMISLADRQNKDYNLVTESCYCRSWSKEFCFPTVRGGGSASYLMNQVDAGRNYSVVYKSTWASREGLFEGLATTRSLKILRSSVAYDACSLQIAPCSATMYLSSCIKPGLSHDVLTSLITSRDHRNAKQDFTWLARFAERNSLQSPTCDLGMLIVVVVQVASTGYMTIGSECFIA
jgi:hypothetical protein